MTIPVFYRPEQSCASAESYSPSAGKPKLVVEDWFSRPDIAQLIRIESFAPADNALLCRAHEREYVERVLSCRMANGFGQKNAEVAASLRYTVGSIVAAAEYVLTTPRQHALQVAVSPTSGFHHAGYDFGGGYCTFNGLMVAAIRAHDLGLARRILILDMDQHYGNGTDDIIEKLNIDYVDHITATKSYDTAEGAMAASDLSRNQALAERQYDLVLYQAGADIHIDDPLGGLLTTEQVRRRDYDVFRGCAASGTPIVWNLAGGYQRDGQGTIAPVLALHRNTMIGCISRALSG